MDRLVLSDDQWERMAPLVIGRQDQKGSTGRDNRMFVEGVLWIVRTGSPWRDLPERYGPYTTVYNRFNRWARAGVWVRGSRGKNGYLEELQEMERRMASPPKPTSKTSEDKLVQTEVEFKTTKFECKDQETSCELGKDELRDANAEIEKLKLEKVERLKEKQNWADAEQIYQEVIKLKRDGQGPGAADDTAILDLRYELAEMQMNGKKYSDAEATARDVWEERRHLPGEDDSSATRSSWR
jgi:hypothetical protein